tara:strand:+ start:106 stop:1203 length:1098 start_codon:yes stop_codon:yes gene_type:complete
MQKKIILFLFIVFASVSQAQQLKELLKFSTIYTSFGANSALFTQGNYTIEEGILVDRSKEHPYDYSINLGIRKLARFDYQSKKGKWYTGDEKEHSDKSIIGAVEGLEYNFSLQLRRQQERQFENRHFFLRYLGDFYTIKAEQMYNGLADVRFNTIDTRLRIKLGNKINITAGVANTWRPLGYEYNALQAWETEENKAWWQLAYNEGYEDEYYYVDGEQNGVDDWYDWYDWNWYNPSGEQIAQTDNEFYKYHFPNILRNYQKHIQDSLGLVREMQVALGLSYYTYSDDFYLHTWADVYPKRWLEENIDEKTLEYVDLENERTDYSLGFILGTKITKKLSLFVEGSYCDMWSRNWFTIKTGINYLFY